MRRALITGGAGFIGSHLARELLRHGWAVRALDSLVPEVHGERRARPAYLDSAVELQVGDVRDRAAVARALDGDGGVDAVFHLAARVGVGQSMYELAEYTSVNGLGTAVLLEELTKKPRPLVVASSMSIYGEGLYRDAAGRLRDGAERTPADLAAGRIEVYDERGERMEPVPTTEDKTPALASIYALGKYDQERMCLLAGRAYGFHAAALRLFNVYGPDQALSNPYTGVLAIFGARLLNGRPPLVYEDGRQRRDFVSVYDVARAFRLALERPEANGRALNVASGRSVNVLEIARLVAGAVGRPELTPEVSGKVRVGDIRHCFADVRNAEALLGYRAEVPLERGIAELAVWLRRQEAVDRVADAQRELERRGLVR